MLKTEIVELQELKLNEDDVLVVKFPVDEDGYSVHNLRVIEAQHKEICSMVKCNVISIPSNIDLLKITKEEFDRIKGNLI